MLRRESPKFRYCQGQIILAQAVLMLAHGGSWHAQAANSVLALPRYASHTEKRMDIYEFTFPSHIPRFCKLPFNPGQQGIGLVLAVKFKP